MQETFISMPGSLISTSELTISQAQDIVNAIQYNPYTQLITCHRLSEYVEIVIFDTQVELGQHRINDIRGSERIAVRFESNDVVPPEVLALRFDFPKVPHLNLRAYELPRSLCLFDEPYSELKLHWTATMFVERIRDWLAKTAKGILHGEDQPLKPLLPYSLNQLILPADTFTVNGHVPLLSISEPIDSGNGIKTFIAQHYSLEAGASPKTPYIAYVLVGKPQMHGVIYFAPNNLNDLHEFLLVAGIDLLAELRNALISKDFPSSLIDAHIILIIRIDKTRYETSVVESSDVRAFKLEVPIKQIGIEIGIWEKIGTTIGRLIPIDATKNGEQVSVSLLNPQFMLTSELAAAYNGCIPQVNQEFMIVGVGALGSQLLINLGRMGWGRWTVIDHDVLLPHNLARHVLPQAAIGYPKAISVAGLINEIFANETIAESLAVNILENNQPEKLREAIDKAETIIDVAASIAASRFLVHDINSQARRVSVFLNPTATDLVVIAEDVKRTFWLDALEMQYYRGILHEPSLQGHLAQNLSRLRYANSCRDISVSMPQDLVALHGAIGSQAIRLLNQDSNQALWIWQTHSNDLSVSKVILPTTESVRISIGEWTLVTDHYLLASVQTQRRELLPNETGGVLIGSYDMSRKIVYVVDTVPSPPDSLEWPTVYVRGYQGLSKQLNAISVTTAGRLEYVGEWHSHPDHIDCRPSQLDCQAFEWLANIMNQNGLPPLMLIVGHDQQYKFYLEKIDN